MYINKHNYKWLKLMLTQEIASATLELGLNAAQKCNYSLSSTNVS